jgi:hypothetical protein
VIESQQTVGSGLRLFVGTVGGKPVELLLDADGMVKRGKCVCGHHQRAGIRMGPCRHLLAMREWGTKEHDKKAAGDIAGSGNWYERLRRWGTN